MKPLAATVLALAATGALAQEAAPAAPASEPRVERLVHEDEGSRIEELRVRGAVQRIVVTPKVGPKKGYEIITGDGSRDLGEGANTSRGAAGKRVWHVLSF
ncbi:MAG: hypothetical protein KIT35_02100 [Piscinibacter sp.]|uniref:hypothetical protein n=1 Tax=Piscinibacter sp. TaxID=1903157 RepID=UPI002586D283|nr:hypothetical protein [Piscinibacter sp.]MCW5662601.1 hypothetical protein [Piscinibacter sp.]